MIIIELLTLEFDNRNVLAFGYPFDGFVSLDSGEQS